MPDVLVRRRRLHAGQERVHASPARFRICMFGRRWGKNALGVDAAMRAALAGQWVGWFEPTYKLFLESWHDLVDRLRPAARKISEQDRRIELLTGGLIEAWTCDTPDPGRGRRYHLIVINEAGLIHGLLRLWQGPLRPTLTDYEGRALILGTSKGAGHDFATLYRKAQPPEWERFTGATLDNPYIPARDVESARRELPPEVFAREYEGQPGEDSGNPFGLDHIAACTVTDHTELFQFGKLTPRAFGWDFARSHDFTVGIGLADHYEIYRFHRWQGVDWGEQKARIHELNGSTLAWGDSTRSRVDDVIVQDLQRMGTPIQGVPFNYAVRQALMQRLQVCLHQHKLRIPDGPIVRELEAFGYEYTARGPRYCVPEGEHDDCAMALALAVFGRDQFGEVPELERPVAFAVDQHPGFTHEPGAGEGRRRKPWEEGPRLDEPETKWLPSKQMIPL